MIIPSYKPQGYLWECLDSLYEQTLLKEEFEVILILNGCKEPYHTDILHYKEQHTDFNLIYIQTDYGNASNARNMGLDVFQGEYVTFIDDDDYVSPSYLEELYNQVSPDVVSISYVKAFNDGIPEMPVPYYLTDAFDYCVKNNIDTINSYARKFFNGPVMKLFHRSCVEGRRYNERFIKSQDTVYMFLISDRINKISYTSKNAIYYRRYRENSVVTQKRSRWDIIKLSIDCMIEYSRIYFRGGYSCYFYLTRIAASILCMFKATHVKIQKYQ